LDTFFFFFFHIRTLDGFSCWVIDGLVVYSIRKVVTSQWKGRSMLVGLFYI